MWSRALIYLGYFILSFNGISTAPLQQIFSGEKFIIVNPEPMANMPSFSPPFMRTIAQPLITTSLSQPSISRISSSPSDNAYVLVLPSPLQPGGFDPSFFEDLLEIFNMFSNITNRPDGAVKLNPNAESISVPSAGQMPASVMPLPPVYAPPQGLLSATTFARTPQFYGNFDAIRSVPSLQAIYRFNPMQALQARSVVEPLKEIENNEKSSVEVIPPSGIGLVAVPLRAEVPLKPGVEASKFAQFLMVQKLMNPIQPIAAEKSGEAAKEYIKILENEMKNKQNMMQSSKEVEMQKGSTMIMSGEQSIAQAEPVAVAVTSKGGLAQSAPVATAIVGKNGIALSSPLATSVSGDFSDDDADGQKAKVKSKVP